MKKSILFLLAVAILSCENGRQISQDEFQKDLQQLFDVVVIENEGTARIFYNFGMKIDSTSIYYDLIRDFNQQYLLFLAREPFLKLDLQSFMVGQDTIAGAWKSIYDAASQQEWFDMYKSQVAYYLKGKGFTVEGYSPPKQILISQEELMEIVSKFFYVYDYEDGVGFSSHVCGGINPYQMEGLVINPLVEAFSFLALVNLIADDPAIVKSFYQGLVPGLSEEVTGHIENKERLVNSTKNYVYEFYKNDSTLHRKMIAEYEEWEDLLPFRIADDPVGAKEQ